MAKKIFIVGTGTDMGKTYISALICKKLKEHGKNISYYKGVLSGATSIENSDAGYVKTVANLDGNLENMISYLYKNPVSPHLASEIENNKVEMEKIKSDFHYNAEKWDYLLIEGSGGIICPIRYDKEKIFLVDLIKEFKTPVLIVADGGLGTINYTVLTINYLKEMNIKIAGIVFNNATNSPMEQDNEKMIFSLTGVKVMGKVKRGDLNINIDINTLASIFKDLD